MVCLLLRVPSNKWQIQEQRQPVAVDQEEHSQECVDAGFGDNVHVEAVAEVDRVDVVAFEIGVHDGEEDLQEQVDGIEKDGEQEQPGVPSVCVLYQGCRSLETYHASPDILSYLLALPTSADYRVG